MFNDLQDSIEKLIIELAEKKERKMKRTYVAVSSRGYSNDKNNDEVNTVTYKCNCKFIKR